jgi:hypothetical protein
LAKAATQTGSRAIRALWKDARGLHDDLSQATVADPDPNLAHNGLKPGQWQGAPHDAMPPDCPVHVVGNDSDGNIWCRSALGDLRCITSKDWNQATVVKLFSPFINYAFWAWPAFGPVKKSDAETGEVTETAMVKRVEHQRLFTCIGNEAAKKPLFDPFKHHRGRGGWQTDSGDFIWHSGKFLYRSANRKLERLLPQEVEGYLYTRQPFTVAPWEEPVTQEESPAQRILKDLCTWNWERPYLDPLLMLGFLVTCYQSGALDQRPVVFTVGGAGVGKTTLHELMKNVLNNMVLSFANTTAAGIYQKLKHDAMPVMVDELENQPGRTQHQSIIDLARIAYSGGDMARGGADHEGVSFTLRSSFFFSAINPPQMTAADRSRMALLNLSRMNAGTGKKIIVKSETDGRMILRQVMDGWQEFNGRLQQKWWDILAEDGLRARDINTYGTLLAACELVVGEVAMNEVGLPVFDHSMLRETIMEATAADRSEQLDNWHKCLNRLVASTIDAWRTGEKPSVGGVMEDLAAVMGADKLDAEGARKKLEMVNLSVKLKGSLGQPGDGPFLAVPSNGPQLARLFQGSDWEGGGWNIALKQGVRSGVVIADRKHGMIKINGSPQRCLLVDWAAFQKYAEEQ